MVGRKTAETIWSPPPPDLVSLTQPPAYLVGISIVASENTLIQYAFQG